MSRNSRNLHKLMSYKRFFSENLLFYVICGQCKDRQQHEITASLTLNRPGFSESEKAGGDSTPPPV